MGRDTDATREARIARHRLREAHEKEADLIGAMSRAIDILDDMRLESSDRESLAAAALELAIGRKPRREIKPL